MVCLTFWPVVVVVVVVVFSEEILDSPYFNTHQPPTLSKDADASLPPLYHLMHYHYFIIIITVSMKRVGGG